MNELGVTPGETAYVGDTLARDVARFGEYDWQAERFTAVDMFPRTANVETVALLTRNSQTAEGDDLSRK